MKPSKPATLKDVAAHAGVSPGLVSRLLNGDANLTIREETREAVLRAVEELDYVPNSTASSLRRARTDTIGLGLDHITNPLFRDIVQGAQAEAAAQGSALLLLDLDELVSSPRPFDRLIAARRIDGLLLQGGYSTEDLADRYALRIPTVVVNSPGAENASGVALEDFAATKMATHHLISLGHRRLGFIGGSRGLATQTRFEGFRAAAQDAGIELDPRYPVIAGWDAADGDDAVEAERARGPLPTAYVVASAVTAMGVIHGLVARGAEVPGDVSVTAIHDPWFAPLLNPSLTTVSLPLFELGRTSVQILLEQISGKPPRNVTITTPRPQLIRRGSTAAPRG